MPYKTLKSKTRTLWIKEGHKAKHIDKVVNDPMHLVRGLLQAQKYRAEWFFETGKFPLEFKRWYGGKEAYLMVLWPKEAFENIKNKQYVN